MTEVAPLLEIALAWRTGDRSIRDLFEAAAPDLDDLQALRSAVHDGLVADPGLVPAWQMYSYDKRSTPSPYLDDHEVGFYDDGRTEVSRHDDATEACADFICREAAWVLRRKRNLD